MYIYSSNGSLNNTIANKSAIININESKKALVLTRTTIEGYKATMVGKGKEEYDIDTTKPTEADIAIAEAVPAPSSNEPPIPSGHARFYCNKCHTVRPFRI
jgi:hypothetical protein